MKKHAYLVYLKVIKMLFLDLSHCQEFQKVNLLHNYVNMLNTNELLKMSNKDF